MTKQEILGALLELRTWWIEYQQANSTNDMSNYAANFEASLSLLIETLEKEIA